MNRPGSRRPKRLSDPSASNAAPRPAPPEGAVTEVEERSAVKARPPTPHQRLADLEMQLGEARDALARQRQEFDEDSSSFAQAIARLSHSERALGHAKAKLMSSEARAEKAEAELAALTARCSELESSAPAQRAALDREAQDERERAIRQACERLESELERKNTEIARLRDVVDAALRREVEQKQSLDALSAERATLSQELADALEQVSAAVAQESALRELAESLSRDSAAGAAECARISEEQKAAEGRERVARIDALDAKGALAASMAELADLTRWQDELVARSDELTRERDEALAIIEDLQTTIADRDAALEVALRDTVSVGRERARFIGVLGALETLGREIAEIGMQARTEAERGAAPSGAAHEPITLRPEPTPKNVPRGARPSAAPEILIDGVRLDP